MASSDLNKEYLNYTKQEARKWHFYLGGDPQIRPDDNPNSFDWANDVNILYRVRENDVNFVTDRLDWSTRIVLSPWNSNTNNNNRTLVFNPVNSIAYLCVSDNTNNRSDSSIRGKQPSIYAPSHVNGLRTYDDGYSWYALFVVDPTKMDIITTSKIPVMSLDDYTTEATSTSLTQKYSQACGADYAVDGTCCLYTKAEAKDTLGTVFDKGDLYYVKTVATCYRCNELAKKLNCEYIFKAGVTVFDSYPTCSPCDCSIDITDKITQIEKNLGNLNTSGFFRHIYANYQDWSDPSEILSVFINLGGLSENDKIISISNPEITFDSITGSGAKAQLITEYIDEQRHRVTGIRLISRGKNYVNGDAIPVISGLENSILNNLIEVNVAPEDFPENPVSMLNNLETCVKVSITNTMLQQNGSYLRNFTRYGLLKDVKIEADNTLATDGLNDNEYQLLKATSVLTLGLTTVPVPV
jgi:hypothetical protein